LKFGQLTLGKIIKIVANRCQILRLKCTKFNFGAPPQTPLGELQCSPRPPSWIKGPTSKGREGRVVEGKGREGKGRGGDPTPSPPLIHISGYAPGK